MKVYSPEFVTLMTQAALAAHPQPVARPIGPVWHTDYPDIQAKGEDSKNKNYFKTLAESQQGKADKAINTASVAPPAEKNIDEYNTSLWNWRTGKSGPIDIRDMPGAGPTIALYNDAKTVHDAGRVGRGVNTMTDGVNPNFSASLDRQNELERDLAAKGALEAQVTGALNANTAAMGGLADTQNSRNMQVAGMQNQNYQQSMSQYLDALKTFRQPNFFRQLAMQAAQGAGQGAVMLAGA